MSDYLHPETLVDADWVAQHVDDAHVRLIEVDEDTTAYEKGHIRNAVGWNWFTDLHDPVRRDYVDQEGLSRLLQQAGVDRDTTVVLYGGNNNWFAAYAYWLARYLGFDDGEAARRRAQEVGARGPRADPGRPHASGRATSGSPGSCAVTCGACATRCWPSSVRSS